MPEVYVPDATYPDVLTGIVPGQTMVSKIQFGPAVFRLTQGPVKVACPTLYSPDSSVPVPEAMAHTPGWF